MGIVLSFVIFAVVLVAETCHRTRHLKRNWREGILATAAVKCSRRRRWNTSSTCKRFDDFCFRGPSTLRAVVMRSRHYPILFESRCNNFSLRHNPSSSSSSSPSSSSFTSYGECKLMVSRVCHLRLRCRLLRLLPRLSFEWFLLLFLLLRIRLLRRDKLLGRRVRLLFLLFLDL